MEAKESIEVLVINGEESRTIQVMPGENLLMAMVKANLPVEFMCTTGKCTTCRCKLEIPAGSASPASETERYRLGNHACDEGYRLTCQLFVHGPLTVYL